MKVRYIRLVIYFICLSSQGLYADEKLPDMALLEFLGSFDTEDDQWLDPTLLVDIEIFDQALEKGQVNEKN